MKKFEIKQKVKQFIDWIINSGIGSLCKTIWLFLKCFGDFFCLWKHRKKIVNIDILPEGEEKECKKWARELYYLFMAKFKLLVKLELCFVLIAISPLFVTIINHLLSFLEWFSIQKWVVSLVISIILISVLKFLMNMVQKNNRVFNFQITATKDVTEGLMSFYDTLKNMNFIYDCVKNIHSDWENKQQKKVRKTL
ncbi:MAG: hypothetical protein IKV85_01880 [Ruminococcus sp.]|nr:hypothetical protein [Ruminococcus sp.]